MGQSSGERAANIKLPLQKQGGWLTTNNNLWPTKMSNRILKTDYWRATYNNFFMIEWPFCTTLQQRPLAIHRAHALLWRVHLMPTGGPPGPRKGLRNSQTKQWTRVGNKEIRCWQDSMAGPYFCSPGRLSRILVHFQTIGSHFGPPSHIQFLWFLPCGLSSLDCGSHLTRPGHQKSLLETWTETWVC